jgi:hypothetical protein
MRCVLSSNVLSISIGRTLQNEKKKDMELTVRIDKILKQRDEAIFGVDLRKCSVIFSITFFHLVSAGKVELVADQLVNIKYQLLQLSIS